MDSAATTTHYWIVRPPIKWLTCAYCGIVKRADGGPNKPCRGIVRVGLRETNQ